MNPQEVIDAYLLEVMRSLPRKERNEIGFELRGLLNELLNEHATREGRPADTSMVLALLRDFGAPTEIARRYRAAGMPIIPEEQTTSFTWVSLIGIGLQWAITLPDALATASLSRWWLTSGLGALWWPGFLVVMAMSTAWARHYGLLKTVWRPQIIDPNRINRTAWIFALIGIVAGIACLISLPWLVGLLPTPLSQILRLSPSFLAGRAWPVFPLWAGLVAIMVAVWQTGRWTALTRRLEFALNLAWVAVLTWWAAGGDIFERSSTTEATRPVLWFVVIVICLWLAAKAFAFLQRPKIHPPKMTS